ncbi:iron-sulfur cluster biosynthesis family protein [Actinidia rufa]|uniref:Iron-sulfur cluster biosynthesis family protein n=1 Tax=Actinidia rufa TaxID=165716 RepID=A0A7J0H0W1_9ERIC|nr:iron-sulfur cluster biosynthesis family protein [Actinidia rufa]
MASISSCFTVTPRSHSTLLSSPKSSTLFKPTSQFLSFRPIASLLLKKNPLSSPPSSKVRYSNRVGLLVPSFVVRARIDVNPTAIRPGGAVESDKLLKDVRRRAMDAVDECGGRVTIGDVASKAGLKLNEAQKAMQALAADTDGFLENSILVCGLVVGAIYMERLKSIRPGGAVDDKKLCKKKGMGMVTIGDVASKAGLKLNETQKAGHIPSRNHSETQKALQAHAAHTDGFWSIWTSFNLSKAGLKLNEARKALQALAADSEGL